jgi:hypothetical protein
MDTRQEILKEKWFSFMRFYCSEGYIDRWYGDQADDPNQDEKSYINLNSLSTMFRLNGEGQWIHKSELFQLERDLMQGYHELFSADDLWYIAQVDTIHRTTNYTKENCGALLEEHGSVNAVLEWWAINHKKNG